MTVELEIKLQGEFHYSATVLAHDLAKVVLGFLGIVESLGWITGIGGILASSINIHPNVADGVEREIDVACTQGTRRSELCRIGLVEYVEEPGPELKLLCFAEVEIFKERDVEVTPV